jgi:hypothetical protein
MITITESQNKWTPFLSYGVVLDDYAHSNDQVLDLKRGDSVVIIEKIQNWYRGYSGSRKKIGIFPSTLIDINTALETPILDLQNLDQFEKEQKLLKEMSFEIQNVLRDWYDALRNLLLKSDYKIFQKLLNLFYQLVDKNKILNSANNTFNQQEMLKKEIMGIVEEGNRFISKYEYIRQNGVILKDFRVFKLYKAHCKSKYTHI